MISAILIMLEVQTMVETCSQGYRMACRILEPRWSCRFHDMRSVRLLPCRAMGGTERDQHVLGIVGVLDWECDAAL